jgi:hypothetical protein
MEWKGADMERSSNKTKTDRREACHKLPKLCKNKVAYSIPTMKNTSKAASEDLIFTLTRRKL